jgi:hypothetical protein
MDQDLKQKKEPSSLGRIFNKLGAEGFDAAFTAVCEGCALQEACKKSVAKCHALNVIAVMAMNISCEPFAAVDAPVYIEKLEEAVKSIKR